MPSFSVLEIILKLYHERKGKKKPMVAKKFSLSSHNNHNKIETICLKNHEKRKVLQKPTLRIYEEIDVSSFIPKHDLIDQFDNNNINYIAYQGLKTEDCYSNNYQ